MYKNEVVYAFQRLCVQCSRRRSWAVSAVAAAESRADKVRRTFVVILVDDLGYMDIGANNPRLLLRNAEYRRTGGERYAVHRRVCRQSCLFTDAVQSGYGQIPDSSPGHEFLFRQERWGIPSGSSEQTTCLWMKLRLHRL